MISANNITLRLVKKALFEVLGVEHEENGYIITS